jgi:hypothetical protein
MECAANVISRSVQERLAPYHIGPIYISVTAAAAIFTFRWTLRRQFRNQRLFPRKQQNLEKRSNLPSFKTFHPNRPPIGNFDTAVGLSPAPMRVDNVD